MGGQLISGSWRTTRSASIVSSSRRQRSTVSAMTHPGMWACGDCLSSGRSASGVSVWIWCCITVRLSVLMAAAASYSVDMCSTKNLVPHNFLQKQQPTGWQSPFHPGAVDDLGAPLSIQCFKTTVQCLSMEIKLTHDSGKLVIKFLQFSLPDCRDVPHTTVMFGPGHFF